MLNETAIIMSTEDPYDSTCSSSPVVARVGTTKASAMSVINQENMINHPLDIAAEWPLENSFEVLKDNFSRVYYDLICYRNPLTTLLLIRPIAIAMAFLRLYWLSFSFSFFSFRAPMNENN